MFYRADRSAVCADVIPFYENGEFKLFYLKDFRDRETFGEGCPWNLLTTKDLVNYVDHGAVLERGTQDEQDLYVFTGSCTKWNNEYYIFYTGHNPHLRA
ncbi:MAG: glycoside hydrolase, partial [Clostridia bacterium]